MVLVALAAGLDASQHACTPYRTAAVAESVLDTCGGGRALALLWRNRHTPAGRARHGAG